ncbi:hypothetical protein MFU01_33230 [Myxococcus fulvus]|uniref:Uncharacterized protein n=1 Tax=Myxococcus fulvus TaxID=33 RepID=A0A511T2A6_MYXFU|nr:hypothetical protein MFU01_33230 [Myxococcus fulvus]
MLGPVGNSHGTTTTATPASTAINPSFLAFMRALFRRPEQKGPLCIRRPRPGGYCAVGASEEAGTFRPADRASPMTPSTAAAM